MENTGCIIHAEARPMLDVGRVAKEIDAALARHETPEVICRMLRTAQTDMRGVMAEMLNVWRIFSADFRAQCSAADRNLVYRLSDMVPDIIGNNYYRQIRGIKLTEERRRAWMMRGRVNIDLTEPFTDGARYEVHDIFVRQDDVDGYSNALAALPNLAATDIASTIWAGRIYQGDFFRAAPQRLQLKMLEHLHAASPTIAQTFVAQILLDYGIPQRYRVLAWTEGVLRPHREGPTSNAVIRWAYAASREEQRMEASGIKVQGRRVKKAGMDSPLREWLATYSGGDNPARFDMGRTLRGFKLTRGLIDWLVTRSCVNILAYYLCERREEFEKALSLGEFAGCVCRNGQCKCLERLLGVVEELTPGLITGFRDRNGAGLLEHLLYRYCDKEPEKGSWLGMCLGAKSDLRPHVAYLRRLGCKDDMANSVGISWADIEAAVFERFDDAVC